MKILVYFIYISVLKIKKKNILKSIELVYKIVEELKDTIDDIELKRCKNNLIENLKSNKNNPYWMCENCSLELYHSKKIISIEEDIINIKNIKIEDIQKISENIFKKIYQIYLIQRV